MNRPRKTALLALLLLSFSASQTLAEVDYGYGADEGPGAAAAATRYPSPSGRWQVAFQHDNPLSSEPLAHIRYVVFFFYPGQQTSVAQTTFIDVLGNDRSAKATPTQDLAKAIFWSPQEDFALLPQERWPDSRPVKFRQAVSLDPTSKWQVVDFVLALPSLVWITPLTMVGDWTRPCALTVAEFSAQTGKTVAVIDSASPEGFQIVSKSDHKIIMKKVLDECASPAALQNFKPSCMALDLRFMRREVAACP